MHQLLLNFPSPTELRGKKSSFHKRNEHFCQERVVGLQPAHLNEAAAHHEERHQVGQHKVGQVVAEKGFLFKVFF